VSRIKWSQCEDSLIKGNQLIYLSDPTREQMGTIGNKKELWHGLSTALVWLYYGFTLALVQLSKISGHKLSLTTQVFFTFFIGLK
jgi:hypothetical protein